jgi:hypothetical protein
MQLAKFAKQRGMRDFLADPVSPLRNEKGVAAPTGDALSLTGDS